MSDLLRVGWPSNVLINVNFPDEPADRVAGIRACRQGQHEVGDSFEERIDPRGGSYFWVGMARAEEEKGAKGTDLRAINEGYVSVTPLHLDLTHGATMKQLRGAFS